MAIKRFLILLLGSFCLTRGLIDAPLLAAAPPASTSAAKAPPSKEAISRWIAALDDDHYLVREQASQDLLTAGAAALDPLLAIANSGRPEPADRAVWILRRLGRSSDNELAVAALEHVVQLKGRPAIVSKAEAELDERSLAACEQKLTPLGAELVMRTELVDMNTRADVLHVHLNSNWHGTPEDLRTIAKLSRQLYFDLDGAAIDDSVAKMFEMKQRLSFVRFTNTKITAAAIDSLKRRHPDAMVVLRNQAMMGVGGQNHPSGVLVTRVEPGTAAAAAGIVAGDVITTFDGHSVPDFDRLTVRIAQHQPGDKIHIDILRGEKKMKLAVTLGKWADQEQ